MSEHQTAIATHSQAPAAVVAKPRISADAFKNLTARLKKPDVTVPALSPVIVAPAADIQVVAPIPVAPVAMPTPVIEVASVAPVVAMPTPVIEAITPVTIVPKPVVQVQPISVADVVVALETPPSPEFSPLPEFVPLSVSQSQVAPESKFPPLPEYVPTIAPVNVQPFALEADVQPASSFQENFTYVPEPGKPEIPTPELSAAELASIDEAVKLEVVQRAAELELENIWRLMLAKPTSEDRVTYLREAAEIHIADEEWNVPEPEHDLSKIVPAFEPEPVFSDVGQLEIVAQEPVIVPVTPLPIAEGQDLAELSRTLLDMMAAGNASGLPQERALAADTLLRLVPRLELKPLVMLSQRLSIMDAPPNLLVSRLIRDPRVEVAGPLLEDCAHITDKDLEQIVGEGEPDKLRMIGRRRKLSRPISDALIQSGDPSVVLTLVRNMEAEISHDGYLSLLVLCENHEELLAPLATRQDLAAPFAFQLFWLAPAQLRRFILSRFLTDSETLTKILKITKLANAGDESEPEPMSQFVLLEALERAARGHIDVAADELSSVMQISAATVARILNDTQGEAIIVMLKAAVYPRSSMAGLLKRLQDAELPLISRERDISELQSMFETLSFNKARILLTYWDWAQSKTGPYAPVH